MPEGTALETTARVASALASAALEDEAVVDVQQYVGTSAPYNFNGLVRHYFLRRAPHLADLQVNLVRQGRALRAEPRRRTPGPRATAADCAVLRRHAAGRRGAARPARAADPRCGSVRTRRHASDGSGRAGQGDLRADPRGRRYRLVRRGPASEGHPRGGRREGRGGRAVVSRCRVGGPNGGVWRGRRAAARPEGARRRPHRHAPAARRAQHRGRAVVAARRRPARRRRRGDAGRPLGGRHEPVSQEPAGRDLRDGRSRGAGRESRCTRSSR